MSSAWRRRRRIIGTQHPVAGTEKKVIVGYDRRFFSDQFARACAEVLAGNGFQVVLTTEPTPTPAVSFAVKAQSAIGGVMITASHNPPAFNGFKLKAYYGGSADPAICQAVEAHAWIEIRCARRTYDEAIKAKQDSIEGHSPGALHGHQEAGGFQADREIEIAFCA